MPRAASVLSDAAADVLRAVTATETVVTLPPTVLDRKVYKDVADALARIGGVWSKRAKGFVFQHDPREALAEMLGTGARPDVQLPEERDKAASWFPTPRDVVDRLAHELADVRPGGRVLEPSAGAGDVLLGIHAVRQDLRLVAVESDEGRHATIAARFAGGGLHQLVHGRFQDFARGEIDDYAAIVMNPPFTEPGDRLAWLTHVELAWSLLAPGGLLLAIVPASLAFRTDRRIVALRELVQEHGGWSELPDGTFAAAGTEVRTLLVSVSRPDLDDSNDWEL